MLYHFFAYLSRMRFIQRWGLMRNTLPENDMEHAMQAAMIAHAIASIGNVRYKKNYNAERIMALALYHDASEVITGDLPTPIKHNNLTLKSEYNKIEEMAQNRLLSMLPDDLRNIYKPLIFQDTGEEEKAIVKASDKICAYVKCLEEEKAGNREFHEAKIGIEISIRSIKIPEVEDFIREFVPGFSMTLDQISR